MQSEHNKGGMPYLPFGLEALKFFKAENGETAAVVQMRDPAFAWFVENTGDEIAAFARRLDWSNPLYQDDDAWTRDVVTEFYGGVPEDDPEARRGRIALINAAVPFLCERLRELREQTENPALLFADLINPPSGVPSFDDLLHEYVEQERRGRRVSKRAGKKSKERKHTTDIPAETLRAIVPKTSLMLRSKVANCLEDVLSSRDGETLYAVGTNKAPKFSFVSCDLPNVSIVGRGVHTEFDKAVNDAVTALHINENKLFTTEMVARVMFGMRESEKPSPAIVAKIKQSIEKQAVTRVSILHDIGADGRPNENTLRFSSYLLPVEEYRVRISGEVRDAYKLMKTPALYEYSAQLKQVATIPAALLDVRDKNGERVLNTEHRIAYKRHMLQRIEQMKHGGNSNVILFSSMAAAAGQDYGALTKKGRHGVADYARDVLDHFKREGHIRDYRLQKKGKAITGAVVSV